MGTNEKLGVNIHVDQLMDTVASNCMNLERLELRYFLIRKKKLLKLIKIDILIEFIDLQMGS